MNDPAHDNRRGLSSYSRGTTALALLGGLGMLAGCFDADAMIASRQNLAQLSRLEEVDLGAFLVTLPYRPDSVSSMVVDFHAFGRVTHGSHKKVSKLI
jgi:hypothetical protein